MERLKKIGDLSDRYDVTGRTLRYYEEIGLLWSSRPDSSHQRWYDAAAVSRLEQILLLRRLRLPVRDIQAIFRTQDLQVAVAALSRKLSLLDQEISQLESLRETVEAFLALLREKGFRHADGLLLLQQQDIAALFDKERPRKPKEAHTMPNESGTMTHVRIIQLKPMKVAYYRAESTSPEADAWSVLMQWIDQQGLKDLATTRYFGFNNPSPSPDSPVYGYEVWVTVPEGIEPSGPIQFKQFDGGLYAVATTYLYEIGERWQQLSGWLKDNSDQYTFGQHQWLEESVNIERMHTDDTQLDLYLPISRK